MLAIQDISHLITGVAVHMKFYVISHRPGYIVKDFRRTPSKTGTYISIFI